MTFGDLYTQGIKEVEQMLACLKSLGQQMATLPCYTVPYSLLSATCLCLVWTETRSRTKGLRTGTSRLMEALYFNLCGHWVIVSDLKTADLLNLMGDSLNPVSTEHCLCTGRRNILCYRNIIWNDGCFNAFGLPWFSR